MMVGGEIRRALSELQGWALKQGGVRAPEATFVDWLGCALIRAGYCEPFQLAAELALGELELSEAVRQGSLALADVVRFRNRLGRALLKYDLAVIQDGAPQGGGLGGGAKVKAIFEVKAANSAGAIERSSLAFDLRKLQLAATWHERRYGERPLAMLVLIATVLDPTPRKEHRLDQRLQVIEGWHQALVRRPPAAGVWLASLYRGELLIDQLRETSLEVDA